ncbi:hypothetical protein [Prescottella agglutinans]|uniref:YCII-related domain-containing protein n=1 Tax=Prescottella agglutinans TaxID=1644129 RepID=A0ABT6MF09_9NOCA|nr:hypothetical protein [Prescottella agglutinans]MDH6282902.1 hypothetical protein [Prescottella agglutinans]
MSTAEQIIAEHRIKPYLTRIQCRCGEVFASYEAHAAHVVAALTNAGKTIVDGAGIYVEYGIERDMPSGDTRVVAAYDRSTAERVMAERPHDTRLVQRRGHIGEWEPAAARVAEGGERGEAAS